MKHVLSLKTLKYNKSRIYKKAHKLMREGFKTTPLSESEVMKLASKYPSLSIKIFVGGDISIRSARGDVWRIVDEGRFYVLYHEFSYSIKPLKSSELSHVQDVFKDLEYTFESIMNHDQFTMGIYPTKGRYVDNDYAV